MKPFDFLIWHCTWTRAGVRITKGHLEEWHLAPKNLRGSEEVKYRGEVYPSREDLPKDFLNGKPIKDLHGRGWTRLGYSALFHQDGTVTVLQEWNQDEWIQSDEITNGVAGINSRARHFCYEGGRDARTKRNADTRTEAQRFAMEIFTHDQLSLNPDLLVGGHNQFNPFKSCPCFDVPSWLREIGFPESNIYVTDN